MRVFILSLLAVSSVHSHAIRYPYHAQLLSYTPARGEFPVYNDFAQGYVRYFDSNGAERLVSYHYPEPLYGVRRFSYAGLGNQQLLRTYGAPEGGFSAESYYQIQDTDELAKAREEHFRRWCEQRYQALKAEMEKLRAEGLKPSTDMMAQIKPLEKIISSTTYTAIGESPEIKRIRDEHLRIWNEARLKVLQQEAEHLRFDQGIKTSSAQVAGLEVNANLNGIVGETEEQKRAREEHLRIYNEQLDKLKRIEAEHKLQQGSLEVSTLKEAQVAPDYAVKSGYQQFTQQQQWQQPIVVQQPIAETPEVIRAREEHLRIYNEQLAKLKKLEADKTRYQFDAGEVIGETAEQKKAREEHLRLYNEQLATVKQLEADQKMQQGIWDSKEGSTFGFQQQQVPELGLKSSFQQTTPQQVAPIGETPEVIRAREEHLRIYNEQLAKLKQLEADKMRYNYDVAEIVGETAEQKKAREEHLRIYNEQLNKVKQMEAEQKLQTGIVGTQTYGAPQQTIDFALKSSFQQITPQQATPIGETPEVIRAREEHLRIYNEQLAKLKQLEADKMRYHYDVAEIVGETAEQKKAREEHLRIYNEQLNKVKQMEAEQKLQPGIVGHQIYGAPQHTLDFALKSSFQQTTEQQSVPIGDTPEVIKAREEHLRLVNEAKLRAQAEGTYNTNDDGSYKAEYQTGSDYKADEKIEQTPILKFVPAIQQPIQPIQNIAILQTSQPINQGIQQQQQSMALLKTGTTTDMLTQPTPVQDTPEVIRAREEHLKLVNEAKLKAEQPQQQDIKLFDSITQKAEIYSAPIDDNEKLREEERLREEQRIMETERLREAERMREEEKMREMERLREIERQKEEEKMLESERLRLKQEEEKRMEMERFEEEKRLKEEQAKRISIEQGSITSGELLGSNLKTAQNIELKAQPALGGGLITGTTSGSGFVLSSQYQNNPYLIRFASQPGTTAYIIDDKLQAGLKATNVERPSLHYLPAAQKESPLFLRYTTSGLKSPNIVQQLSTASLTGGSAVEKYSTYSSSSSASSSSSSSSSSGSSSLSNLKVGYGESSTGLSELEKATREHFRAHELALEQLRLANLKKPYNPDCN